MLEMLMRGRIVDARGTEIFEEDVPGEVLVRGPSMMTLQSKLNLLSSVV
jgi:hypothetical protein